MHEFDGKYAKVIAVIIISVLAGILIVACTNAASSKHESNLQEIAAESNFVSYDESRNIAFYNNSRLEEKPSRKYCTDRHFMELYYRYWR